MDGALLSSGMPSRPGGENCEEGDGCECVKVVTVALVPNKALRCAFQKS